MLEWYDFAIYGIFAVQIGRTFFPSHDPVSQVLSAFGIFAIGYLMRPIGGLVVGHIGDRIGRTRALTLSIAAMAVPTFLVGILPGFETLGLAAPILLTLLRVVQGLSVGGECPTSIVFLVEQAPAGRRGMCGAVAYAGNAAGVLLGSASGWLIAALMTAEQMDRWGWRLPFLAGLVVGLIGYLLRRHLHESGAPRAASFPLREVLRHHLGLLVWLAALAVFGAVGFYVVFLYVVSWLQLVDGVAPAHALEINTASMAGLIVTMLAGGWLSDHVGRRPVLIAALVLAVVAAYPLLRLMLHADPAMIGLGQAGFVLIVGLFFGAEAATIVEATPPQVRCSAVALGGNVTMGVVGGLTPLVAAWLVHRTADDLSPAYLMMAAAAVSLLALLLGRR
jgi:MFS transporter, MHS family, proline/betaine transporter